MIGFDIEVNIFKSHDVRNGSSAMFSGPEYLPLKKKAEKFAEAFRQDGDNVNFFVSYNIYNEEGVKKNGTYMLVRDL